MNHYDTPGDWICSVFQEEVEANPCHLVPLIDIYIYVFISSYDLSYFFELQFDFARDRLAELSEFCDVLAAE